MPIRIHPLPLLAPLLLAGCEYDFLPTEYHDGQTKAREIVQFLAAQQSEAVAAGSPLLGNAGSLGPSGQVSLSVRAQRVDRGTPSVTGTTISTSGRESATFATENGAVTGVSLDVGVSVLRGFDVGETHVAGITLFGGASLHPGFGSSDLDITGGDGPAAALGVRLGVLEETDRTPGIAITTMWRNLPEFSFDAPPLPTDDGGTMRMTMDNVRGYVVQSRLAVSREFGNLGVLLGFGRDNYEATADLLLALTGPGSQGTQAAEQELSFYRNTIFLGATWRLRGVAIGAEVGRLSGSASQDALNRFEGQGDWARTYLSVGARIGK